MAVEVQSRQAKHGHRWNHTRSEIGPVQLNENQTLYFTLTLSMGGLPNHTRSEIGSVPVSKNQTLYFALTLSMGELPLRFNLKLINYRYSAIPHAPLLSKLEFKNSRGGHEQKC